MNLKLTTEYLTKILVEQFTMFASKEALRKELKYLKKKARYYGK